MPPTLSEMFRRLLNADGQTRAARSVESFGWLDMGLGFIILIRPYWAAWFLQLPALTGQGANYLRLAGLLVGGLGMLYVVAGRLNALGFVFASLLDRPLVPCIMAVLWYKQILPGTLALAFSVSDFSGFLWTLSAWRRDARLGPESAPPRLVARIAAAFFGFVSGVIRNSRTFHPDGRVFRGTIRSLQPVDESYARAAEQLAGSVLMRIGMGLMKKGSPLWLADRVPDAPSVAMRVASSPGGITMGGPSADCLDLLCTAGGDRLWKLVLILRAAAGCSASTNSTTSRIFTTPMCHTGSMEGIATCGFASCRTWRVRVFRRTALRVRTGSHWQWRVMRSCV
jgi:hypothetical protein